MKKSKVSLLRRFVPYYKKYVWLLIADLFFALLTTVCEIVLPLFVKEITSLATSEGGLDENFFTTVLTFGLWYIALRIIDTGANFYMASVGHIMGTKIETDMRRDLFSHLQKLSHSYYDNTKIGTLMSRITSDLFDVTEFAHHCPEEYFISGTKLIASFIILCNMSWQLSLIVFATIPLAIIGLAFFRRAMRRTFKESRKQTGEINAQVEDSLLGIRVVKSFVGEEKEEEKFKKGNEKYLAIKKVAYFVMGGFQSTNRLFDGIMYIVVVIVGGYFLSIEMFDASVYVAFIMYISTLLTSIRRIVDFAEQFQRGMTGIERFTEIMDVEPEITDSENAVSLENVEGSVVFDDVSFRYESEKRLVLEHLSLSIKPGESVAIVGPSGGGKTTLCSLIPRFYEIESGTIRIDGKDIKNISLDSLRSNIGVVQQDVYLFSGSIRENIAYGKDGASEEEIINASRLAGAHEFIMSLPNGYDTYVGERGVKLSGGQKQRISIARVFLKNPRILILDEATSALDNESERLVQRSLEELAKGRTTLTVAHRLTTIKGADRILVLTENGIVEEGTHEELILKNGIYADLYKLYATM